jgi:phage pi2 protein 07
MLLINGIKFDQLLPDHPFKEIHKVQLSLMDKMIAHDNVIFVTPDRMTSLDAEGKKQYPAGAFILRREKYVHPTAGEFDVVCYDTSFMKDKNEVYRPRKYDFPGKLDTKDKRLNADLIWFLIYVSPHTEPIPELKEHQNLIRKTVYLELQNKKADATKRMDQQKKELVVRNAILNDKDGLDLEQIRSISRNYSIGHVDLKSEEELRIELHDLVLGPDARTGKIDFKKIDKFLDIMPEGGSEKGVADAEITDFVQKLLERKILTIKEVKGGWTQYLDEGGVKITAHHKEITPEYHFVEFFKRNPQVEKALREKLKAPSLV